MELLPGNAVEGMDQLHLTFPQMKMEKMMAPSNLPQL
jgi:hypothetical protein